MRKSLPFNKLSNIICAYGFCRKNLKQRLVEEKPTVVLCFKHYKQLRNYGISDRAIKRGEY